MSDLRIWDAASDDSQLRAMAKRLVDPDAVLEWEEIRQCLALNLFGVTYVGSLSVIPGDARPALAEKLRDAFATYGERLVQFLGRVLRAEESPTSWMNTEKGRVRHRALDVFSAAAETGTSSLVRAIAQELTHTVTAPAPLTTLDARAQSADLLIDLLIARHDIDASIAVRAVAQHMDAVAISHVRTPYEQAFMAHDSIDPFVETSEVPVIELLARAAQQKSGERGLEFGLRLIGDLRGVSAGLDASETERVLARSTHFVASLATTREGVLTAPDFEAFIAARLPARSSRVDDYVVNRHQVITGAYTIQDVCRLLIAAPENSSSDARSRLAVAAFARQVFGIGHAANMGLSALPFFIDHGHGDGGERLDWPSFVFIPAGAIWGKGAGVDLSCGVAVGGGVDLNAGHGRDGSYIGGSWSATLYHGHSHVGGGNASAGAASRSQILHFGLTVDDACRLPWGEYIEAEQHLNGDRFAGVRTFRLAPRNSTLSSTHVEQEETKYEPRTR